MDSSSCKTTHLSWSAASVCFFPDRNQSDPTSSCAAGTRQIGAENLAFLTSSRSPWTHSQNSAFQVYQLDLKRKSPGLTFQIFDRSAVLSVWVASVGYLRRWDWIAEWSDTRRFWERETAGNDRYPAFELSAGAADIVSYIRSKPTCWALDSQFADMDQIFVVCPYYLHNRLRSK